MSQNRNHLIEEAAQARQKAYAPFSNYFVGACAEDEDGRLFTGCNIENASYGSSMCAERVAVFKLVSSGSRELRAIAVVTEDGGAPCGNCLQVLREFTSDASKLKVYCGDAQGNVKEFTLHDLLPIEFNLSPERK